MHQQKRTGIFTHILDKYGEKGKTDLESVRIGFPGNHFNGKTNAGKLTDSNTVQTEHDDMTSTEADTESSDIKYDIILHYMVVTKHHLCHITLV